MLFVFVFYLMMPNELLGVCRLQSHGDGHRSLLKDLEKLALPVLLCGSETWTVKASDARRITAAEMKHVRRTAGYTWIDYKTNAQIANGLKNNTNFGQITGIQEKLDTTCK